jgi:MerR family transcriptional regulator, copper efflux regulator
MSSMLTIGQLAEATGVAAKTIRYYEEIGVLSAPRRTKAGYRQYERAAVPRLDFIRRARSLGLPLRDLKTLAATLDGGPRPALRPQLRALVREQLAAVRRQRTELDFLQRQLERVLHRLVRAPAPHRNGVCRCLEIDGRARPSRPARSSA